MLLFAVINLIGTGVAVALYFFDRYRDGNILNLTAKEIDRVTTSPKTSPIDKKKPSEDLISEETPLLRSRATESIKAENDDDDAESF